jgi:hypothetical protein
MEKARAPGLRWRKSGKPIWRASRAAIKANYPVKSVPLTASAHDSAALVARCHRLTAEMNDWIAGRHVRDLVFDGTIRSLFAFYQTDRDSPYHNLEPASRHPYDSYIGMMVETVGARRIDALDGRDLKRWYEEFSAPRKHGGKPRLAAARMAMIALKTALSFGVACRKPGCADLLLILQKSRFIKSVPPRTEAPTASEIVAAREAATRLGHAAAALAYALQFEGAMRQWDVTGKWVPLTYKTPSAVIDGNWKWLGPMWSQIDQNLILRYKPAKTQFTTGAEVTIDLKECPMVLVELGKVPDAAKFGPIIVNPATGLPYRNWYYGRVWRNVRKATGIRPTVWNRDLRAAGVTEGREAAAANDDLAKVAGHTGKRTTAKVYDRAHLAAHRRVAQARTAYRDKNED